MDIRSVGDFSRGTTLPAARPAQQGAPAQPVAANGQPAAVAQPEQLEKAVADLNKAMKTVAPGIEFSVEQDTHMTVVKVVDQNTREVLRQMPTEETLEIAKALDKLQGLLIRNQA
jgi:flagellar protein FlaG